MLNSRNLHSLCVSTLTMEVNRPSSLVSAAVGSEISHCCANDSELFFPMVLSWSHLTRWEGYSHSTPKRIPPPTNKDRIQDSLGASENNLLWPQNRKKKKTKSLKSDAEISLPSLLYILNALEKYSELNLGWGLRDKSWYKQKNISETTGHGPLKGSWESCKGIPETLALPSQSSVTMGKRGRGRGDCGCGHALEWKHCGNPQQATADGKSNTDRHVAITL